MSTLHDLPPPGLLAALQRVSRRVSAHLERRLAETGVSALEGHLLVHLDVPAAHPPRSIADLNRAFGLRPSTLTSVLDRLECRRLVLRSIHPRDRRSFLVAPTDAGRARAAEVREVLERFERSLAARLSPLDGEGFEHLVEAVEDATSAWPEGRSSAQRRAAAIKPSA